MKTDQPNGTKHLIKKIEQFNYQDLQQEYIINVSEQENIYVPLVLSKAKRK